MDREDQGVGRQIIRTSHSCCHCAVLFFSSPRRKLIVMCKFKCGLEKRLHICVRVSLSLHVSMRLQIRLGGSCGDPERGDTKLKIHKALS